MTDREDIIIIGAGPAGLTAAYELAKGGRRPLLLEKGSKVGGLARTETFKGYRFDIGGHRFFTNNEQIDRLWKNILGKKFAKVSRLSRIYFDDRYINYPLSFFDVLSNLGIIEGALILLSYIGTRTRPSSEQVNFEQWVTSRFGKRLYTKFFKIYTEKVWGIPCDQIQADWAAQRIDGLSLTRALSNAILGTKNSRSLISKFHYPILGPGMMWQRLQELMEDKGGKTLLNAEALRIHCGRSTIKHITADIDGQSREIVGRHFISTIPLTELILRIYPQPDGDVIDAAMKLTYRAFILVGLIIDRKNLFPDQWIYVHSPRVKVGRIQNFKNWSPAMVPDLQKTSVGMEYFCTKGDHMWNMPDAQLIEMASRELCQLGMAELGEIIDGFVERQPNAYPVYNSDYEGHVKVIRNFLSGLDNLQTIGRNGLHRYCNMDLSMHTGILAAQNISGANHDLWEISAKDTHLEKQKSVRKRHLYDQKFLMRTFARMDKLAFGVSMGAVSGLVFFIATIFLVIKGGEVVGPNLQLLSQYFFGYTVTVRGAFIAFGYGFLWGALFGFLFAGLRNLLFLVYVSRVKKRMERLSLKDILDSH